MVKADLHDIYQLGKLSTFINTEDGAPVSMVTREFGEGLDCGEC